MWIMTTIVPDLQTLANVMENINSIVNAVNSRLQAIEQWANVAQQVTDATPGAVQGVEARLLTVERVAESVASQLQPRVTDLHDRIDRSTIGTDRLQDRVQSIEASVNQLTTELNQFGPTAVTEIKTIQTQAGARLDELANAIQAIRTSPVSPAGSGYNKKSITEHKIIMQQHRLGDDRKEYRNWLEKMKNAIDQVDIDMRKVLDEIDITNWGKGEETEWLAKQNHIKDKMVISDVSWEQMKRDMYAVLMEKTEGDALLLARNQQRDGFICGT